MSDNISVRQWQEMFQSGIFHQDNFHVPEQAGWGDFYDPLNNKGLQNLSKLVMSVTYPFILDNYHVYFLHHTPRAGPMFCCVYFDLLSAEWDARTFYIALDSPHERKKWALMTRRYGDGAPEFECGNVREMIRYINRIGPELEQGVMPPFVAEKRAVEIYARIHGEPSGIHVYREGAHRYSYTSFQDKQQRNVMATASLEDAPSGFVPEHAEIVKEIHVYCPENVGKPLPDLVQPPAPIHFKKKEAER